MKAIIQIMHVNEVKRGTARVSGRPYELQTAYAMLLTEDGQPEAVGELLIPRDQTGDIKPGMYTGNYQFGVDEKKNIGARLVSLIPTVITATSNKLPTAPAAAPAASKA